MDHEERIKRILEWEKEQKKQHGLVPRKTGVIFTEEHHKKHRRDRDKIEKLKKKKKKTKAELELILNSINGGFDYHELWNNDNDRQLLVSGFAPPPPGGGGTGGGIYNPPPSPDEFYPSYYPTITSQMIQGSNGAILGQAETCVACTLVTCMDIFEYRERGVTNQQFSISWVFGNRLSSDFQGEGMITSQALDRAYSDGILKYGSLDEPDRISNGDIKNIAYGAFWSDNRHYSQYAGGYLRPARDLISSQKSAKLDRSSRYRIGSWWYCSTNDSIKAAIRSNGCAIIEMYCGVDSTGSNWLWDVTSNGIANKTNFNNTEGHTMCVIGWKNINGGGYWICANSWGTWEGDNGIYYVAMGHPALTNAYGLTNMSTPAHPPEGQPSIDISSSSSMIEVGEGKVSIRWYDYRVTDHDGFHIYANDNEGSGDYYKLSVPRSDWYPFTDVPLDKPNHTYSIVIVPYNSVGTGDETRFNVTTKSIARPNNWSWYTVVQTGRDLRIYSWDWNDFTKRINEFRQYKEVSTYSFYTVSQGEPMYYWIVNQAVSAINELYQYLNMSPPLTPVKGLSHPDVNNNPQLANVITASFFNGLKDAINAL